MHCKSHTPGYYSMTDMNEDSNSSSWSPYYGDKNLLNAQYYNGMVQKTVRDEYTGYEKDVLRQKMIEHDMIFKTQVYELHRLYKVQREMMEEAKRKELYKQQRSIETSSSSSFLPSQIPSEEVRKWQMPSFPLANSGCVRPSIMGSEVIDSPSSWMKGHNNQADLVSDQNRCDMKGSAFLDSRPSKVRKTLFDLQIPADEYIVIEEEEQSRDAKIPDTLAYPPDGNHRLPPGSSINKYLGGGKTNDIRDTSSGSRMKIPHLLADLNEPIQVEESNSPKFVEFSGRSACHEEIRGLDIYSKSNSQFVDLSRDFLPNSQCESSNGNVSNLSETNKGARRGWLSYMYEGGNCGTDANCVPKFHQSEKLPSTSQQTLFMASKPKQLQGILPPDSRKDGTWTDRNRGNEFSNRSHGHSNYNQPDSVVTSHISNPYPWYNTSDAANSWSHSVTSWGRPNPCLTQKLPSLHTRPSVIQSETSSREMNGNPSLNPVSGSRLPIQNGFCQGSPLVSKDLSATLSSFGCNNNNLKRHEIDIAASNHLTSHAFKNALKGSDVMDPKSGKDLDLNVVLPCDSFNEEPLPRDIEVLDGKRKCEDHSTAFSWLREKPMYNNVSTITKKDLESGFLQPPCNTLRIGETVKDPNPLSTQNVSAASSSCDVRVKRESEFVSNGKLLGFPIFGKIGISKNDSSSTSASIQSYRPDVINTKNKGKHRGFDMNVACDSTDAEFDELIAAEAIIAEKGKDTKCNNFRNFDLNSCVSEDEDILDSSVASTSGKVKVVFEIDLEVPAVPETVEDLSPTKEQKQHEGSLQLLSEETEKQQDQVVRSAAEAIVALSYGQDPRTDCTHLDPSELPDPLKWFADVISTSAEEVETRLHEDFNGRNGREIETPRELDEYEAMTLQLTETPEADYMPEPFVPEILNLEDVGAPSLPGRPRRGPARRGRMRKDFQRDILPGLVSLSRHEVTEDLQTFGGLMRATGHQWNGGMTRRNGTRSGAARGRRRCVVEPSPAVVVAPVCNPMIQNFNSIQLGVEDRSLAGWGKTTRRARGQRSAAGNNLAVAIT